MQVVAIELVGLCNGCCLPSLIETEQKNYEVCESFDFGSSLQNVCPLLRFVFEYLRYADLKSAGKVNDTWGKYAEEELARRNGPSWLCLTELQTVRHILERSTNFMYDEVTFSLVFYKSDYIILSKLSHLRDKHYVGISFRDYTREALPKGKEFWTIHCWEVTRVNMVSPNKSPQFSILSIPSIPHVAIRRLVFLKRKPAYIRNILEENLQSDEVIDCLLVFCESSQEEYLETIMHEILRRQEASTIALGGGVTETIDRFNRPDKSSLFHAKNNDQCCIAFIRKRDTPVDFNAFSLVIKLGDDFESRVSDFRRRMLLRKNSFMIRVYCAWPSEAEKKSLLIYKYFPRTPVFGFLTMLGEIGWNRLPGSEDKCRDAEDDTPKKKSKVYPKTWHQYATVLALITWGPKV